MVDAAKSDKLHWIRLHACLKVHVICFTRVDAETTLDLIKLNIEKLVSFI